MNDKLGELRTHIDQIDQEIIGLLKKRMDHVKEIGEVKKKLQIEALDSQRWREVNRTRRAWAVEAGIDPSIIEQMWNTIHEWSLSIEEKI